MSMIGFAARGGYHEIEGPTRELSQAGLYAAQRDAACPSARRDIAHTHKCQCGGADVMVVTPSGAEYSTHHGYGIDRVYWETGGIPPEDLEVLDRAVQLT